MREQAVVESPRPMSSQRSGPIGYTIAVTGGKGGVGKTQISANIALALAERGLKTLAVDLDLGLANLDVLFGITVQRDLEGVVDRRVKPADCIVPVDGGVSLLPSASGVARMASLDENEREWLWAGLREAAAGYHSVILDTAAGIGPMVIDGLVRADRIVLVTTPDPTALTDAYALLKVLVADGGNVPPVSLIVNLASDAGEAVDAYRKLRRVVRAYLSIDLDLMAGIPRDPAVSRASRLQRPLLLDHRGGSAARTLDRIGSRLADEVRKAARRNRKEAS